MPWLLLIGALAVLGLGKKSDVPVSLIKKRAVALGQLAEAIEARIAAFVAAEPPEAGVKGFNPLSNSDFQAYINCLNAAAFPVNLQNLGDDLERCRPVLLATLERMAKEGKKEILAAEAREVGHEDAALAIEEAFA